MTSEPDHRLCRVVGRSRRFWRAGWVIQTQAAGQRCHDAEPASATLARHRDSVGSASLAGRGGHFEVTVVVNQSIMSYI